MNVIDVNNVINQIDCLLLTNFLQKNLIKTSIKKLRYNVAKGFKKRFRMINKKNEMLY